jgi:hypothetical protein
MALLPLGRSFSKAYRNRQPRKNRPEDEYECLLPRKCCPIPRTPQAIKLDRRLKRRNFHRGLAGKAGIPEGLASRRMVTHWLRRTHARGTETFQDAGAVQKSFLSRAFSGLLVAKLLLGQLADCRPGQSIADFQRTDHFVLSQLVLEKVLHLLECNGA